jgi:hypothetical protein
VKTIRPDTSSEKEAPFQFPKVESQGNLIVLMLTLKGEKSIALGESQGFKWVIKAVRRKILQ